MLSFASVAYSADRKRVGTFQANLERLPEASEHPETMEWWKEFPDAWAAHRENTEAPAAAMLRYEKWLDSLPGSPVFVAYPACVDFMFVYWYMHRFVGRSPFGFVALDIKTLAMAALDMPFHWIRKQNMPEHWFPVGLTHTHHAIDDATVQGEMFFRILDQLRGV
jgi:DNA polymerase III alpha subunit (gram-positive type)